MSTIISISDKSPEEIEEILTDHQGKAEIFDDGIHLDRPNGHIKSEVGRYLAVHISQYVDFFGGKTTSGTDGTLFRNGVLLSPDVSVWTNERLYSTTTAHRLYSEGTAPRLVMECEWWHERNHRKKAFDKVRNFYFGPGFEGLGDVHNRSTKIEEVWVLIMHMERVIVPAQNRSRVHFWWGYVPIFNEIVTSALSRFIEVVYCLQSEPDLTPGRIWGGLWTLLALLVRFLCRLLVDIAPGEQTPPTDPTTPYLAVFFRDDTDPTFYHLKPNQLFLAPWRSAIYLMKPLKTNRLLAM